MFSKNSRLLIYSTLIAILLNGIVYFILHKEQKKIAVVDAVKLFSEYNMKKELEKQASAGLLYYERQMDSLKREFQMKGANSEEAKSIVAVYQTMQANLDNEYKGSNQAINEQVWKRLNPLLEQFGKEQNLHLIIGANGMGSVLYNDDYFDLTNEVIHYVNTKYENGN